MNVKAVIHRSHLVPVLGALIACAWLTLWVWGQSPYGRYLDHSQLGELAPQGALTDIFGQAAVYVLGWVLMTTAMMLPTTLPLIEIFRRLTRERGDRVLLVALLIAGYLFAWLVFGVVAHVFDLSLHRLFDRSAWLQANAWVFGAGPLVVAGAFQFTSLKYRCLDKCRTPLSFVLSYWRDDRHRWRAFQVGVGHGLFCVGCCWALMLLMFAAGTVHLAWMLVLGLIMAVEK